MTRKQFMGELRSSLEGIVSPMVVQQNIMRIISMNRSEVERQKQKF